MTSTSASSPSSATSGTSSTSRSTPPSPPTSSSPRCSTTAGTLWYVPETSKDKIAKLAPSVGISAYDRQMTEPLQRMLELAKSLGADVRSEKTTAAKKRFEDAAARLRAATKAKPDIKVLMRLRQPGHLLRLRLEPLHRPGVLQGPRRELRRAERRRAEGQRGLVREPQLGERRQVRRGRHHHGQPHVGDPAGRHRRGDMEEAAER